MPNMPFMQDITGMGRLAETQQRIATNRRADMGALQQREMNKITLANARQEMLQRESNNVWKKGLTQHMQQMPQGSNPYLHQRDFAMKTGRMDFVSKLDDQQFERIGDLMAIDPDTAITVANNTIGVSQGLQFANTPDEGQWSNMYTATDPVTGDLVRMGQKADGTWGTAPGAPQEKQPLVSIAGDKQETEFGKTMGKGLATQFLDLQKESADAGTTKYRYRRANQLIHSVATGATKPTELTAKRLAKSLGINIDALGLTDDVSGAEALKAIGIDLTMDVVQRTKGAVSNKEMDLFAQTAPGLSNTLEGNMLILEMSDKMATMKQQVGKLARDYKKNNNDKFDEGFYDALDKYHTENPLFTNDVQARIDAIGGARESIQVDGETAVRSDDGNYYIKRPDGYYMVEQ